MQKHIVVVGNVATGKSTMSALWAKRLSCQHVEADEFYKTNPFFPLAIEDRRRWSLVTDLWFLYERVKLARLTKGYLRHRPVIVDSGLPMSWVYAHSRLSSGFSTIDEWELYLNLYKEMVVEELMPDLVVYLKAEVPFLRQRIIKRGREFELAFHSEEYLESLAASLEVLVNDLKKSNIQVVEYQVDDQEFSLDAVVEDLRRI
jgi:deoxyadenosine/deoxycytidine kinase